MSALERNPNTVDDEGRGTVQKSVLFCPDCGRTASPDEWERNVHDDVETIECPVCGATLTARPRVVA